MTRSHSQLPYIREPLHNLRELSKQLLLLEDHVISEDRRCPDCMRKHLLLVEGLAEEATAMDESGTYAAYCDTISRTMRVMEREIFTKENPNYAQIKKALREHRKFITQRYGPDWTVMYGS